MNKQTQQYTSRLQYLVDNQCQAHLFNGLKGIEKESLRISPQGSIAQTDHPAALGAALTHPHITTDYSEALLEFITPPFADIKETLTFLEEIHQYVYDHLDDEMLLSTSMPCGINGDESIRIAEYGQSNIGQMKHVYRRGLWHRYGRSMQTIAGIHFNYSVPESLWPLLQKQSKTDKNLQDFISDAYFGLIRNFQRQGWVLLYLFGASPAICKSYFKDRPHLAKSFDEFDYHTLYAPYATSLRMSDVGYQSKNQAGLKIDYNSVDRYVDSLGVAIETPYVPYQEIGLKEGDEYLQLNTNILQIENEFYNTIRPKQPPHSGEKPTLALKRRGVQYIEVRSLDLDPFSPVGIDEHSGRFLEAFLLNCLMQESPMQTEQEQQVNADNQRAVAYQGRRPGLELDNNGQAISLTDWALQILQSMQPLCDVLDQNTADKPYTAALNQQFALVTDTNLTPSARVITEMEAKSQSFSNFGLNISTQHQFFFKQKKIDALKQQYFEELANDAHDKQKEIERADRVSFDQFLSQYFSQK